jgi:hypothetical protein
VRIRYKDEVLLLIITNYMSWALEKHPEPEIQPVSMHNTTHIGAIFADFVTY